MNYEKPFSMAVSLPVLEDIIDKIFMFSKHGAKFNYLFTQLHINDFTNIVSSLLQISTEDRLHLLKYMKDKEYDLTLWPPIAKLLNDEKNK